MSTLSSQLRTSRKKLLEDGTTVDKLEDIKPLIIHKIGLMLGTPEKLVVNLETLAFRPPTGVRLQAAKRGKPFRPENLHLWGENRGMCSGGKAAVEDNSSVDVEDVKTVTFVMINL